MHESEQAQAIAESIAALMHEIWAGWQQYVFDKSERSEATDWKFQIPEWARERWTRQIETPYAELSEEEKESDRVEARKVIALFSNINRLGTSAIVDSQAQKIAEQNQLLENCAISFKESLEQIAEQAKEIERLKAIESELESVKRMSSGVAGYHLNGEIATWEEVGL